MPEFASWKPILTALLLPPAPLLLLILLGAGLIPKRPRLGFALVLSCVALIWLSCCQSVGSWLQQRWLHPPEVLSTEMIQTLGQQALSQSPQDTAIVVLGGGRIPFAAEYQTADLSSASAERLRYGLWLSQQTHLPVAFSGGIGWAQPLGPEPEADIAARIARQNYHMPLRWIENRSRDTRENAQLSWQMLKPQGIRTIVLVTHASHMPRALKAFDKEAGPEVHLIPAPIGASAPSDRPELNWLPTLEGFFTVRANLRELLGQYVKAY